MKKRDAPLYSFEELLEMFGVRFENDGLLYEDLVVIDEEGTKSVITDLDSLLKTERMGNKADGNYSDQ